MPATFQVMESSIIFVWASAYRLGILANIVCFLLKKLILIKKKPNRKPLPKDNAVYGKCGHRCDLCVHYTESSEEFRSMLIPHLNAVYGTVDWSMRSKQNCMKTPREKVRQMDA